MADLENPCDHPVSGITFRIAIVPWDLFAVLACVNLENRVSWSIRMIGTRGSDARPSEPCDLG